MVQRTLSDAPVRTCIGCRQRDCASALVRLVARTDSREAADGAQVVVDVTRTMPGRGAWLHPREDCVSRAVRRKAFGPALRVGGLTVAHSDLSELVGKINDQRQAAEDMSTP
ncbi:YlxR family protein [Gordonia sp. (in: high G+C Gram-positive bacteria)]|uniref:YlxR family protein n=1 Tax=Gordonia sp. (in: high G+C Gram-positive bacteria) TaxID=84139 RepID=UPI001DD5A3A3|nr:YlxR family protein [Gordonia sp. (in: high G+C Gram-positive bacteria)]MCB1296152.1 YlxR family protein [Gordonia sp. (in: high G+C Gram-positive bacteria)]HMS75977.1 YlxR family protein [Gordonia sp. (in: high G+C Gram-positive bacteria)]HQV19821.1 YlxR family protein [Gordonia sp. (in: high G+C Gram-positive bacteria)]